jgi:hypothetical protein
MSAALNDLCIVGVDFSKDTDFVAVNKNCQGVSSNLPVGLAALMYIFYSLKNGISNNIKQKENALLS